MFCGWGGERACEKAGRLFAVRSVAHQSNNHAVLWFRLASARAIAHRAALMNAPTEFTIRAATEADTATILEFIRRLAEYEKLSHQVTATPELLREQLFGAKPAADVVLACEGARPVGFGLFFTNFSTFLAKPGIYLEDLFVLPEARGKGYGRALLVHLARLAVERGCGRFEWSALDWNTPAWDFYKSLGAAPLEDWTIFRITGDALVKLASPA